LELKKSESGEFMDYNGDNNQLQDFGVGIQQQNPQPQVVEQIAEIQQLAQTIETPACEEPDSPTSAVSLAQLTAFFTCTERYERIMQVFPIEFRVGTNAFDQDVHLAKIRGEKEAELAVITLFNLFSEEFYLESLGALPPDIWSVWKGQMHLLFRTKLLKETWAKLQEDFASQSGFQNFVTSAMSDE